MKRETLEWLRHERDMGKCPTAAKDALATDAEVKRAWREHREAIAVEVAFHMVTMGHDEEEALAVRDHIRAMRKPLKPKRRTRRKAHSCYTSSSDEQVLCDAPRCPRNYRKGKS